MRAIKQQDPDGHADPATTTCPASRRCFSPASAAIRRPAIWAARAARQAGRRPLVADRDRLADHRRLPPASACSRSSPAPAAVPCPGYDLHALDDDGQVAAARARRAICRSACRCRRAAARRCGRTTRATATPISPTSPAGTAPATPAMIDADGDVWVMGRTDDIINVAGHRLSTGSMEEVLAVAPGRRRMRRDRRQGRAEGPDAAAASSC